MTRKRAPGRPSKPARQRATTTITVRLYREDAAILDALLAQRGESASEVLRAALRALQAGEACSHG
jgi:Arc/MetJ-type ribon-helix-helix transcriptional regulator